MYYEKPKDTIYRRKSDDRWCCELTLGIDGLTGKKITKSLYGKTRSDVKAKRDDFLQDWNPKSYDKNGCTLKAEMEKWLYKIKINKVKSSSFDRLEQTFKYQVSPALDYVGITKISDFDVYAAQAVLDYVKNQGYKYSTQKKTKDFLSDFFKFAVANNMAKLNPVWLITLKADKTIITEDDEEEKEKIIVFNNDEIERFKKACTAKYINGVNRFHQGIFFIFMLNTGIRLGEALATKYSDIDFETGVYHINKTVTAVKERDENGKSTGKKKRYIQTPKTNNSIRKMKLNLEVLNITKELKAAEPEGYDGLIIHGPNGAIFGERSFDKRFYSILKYAGIKQCGVHTLRHTFASMAYMHSKGQIELVSKLLGHSDPAFTARIYVSIFDSYKDAVMNNFII